MLSLSVAFFLGAQGVNAQGFVDTSFSEESGYGSGGG